MEFLGQFILTEKEKKESRLTPGFQGWVSRYFKCGITWGVLHITQSCVPGDQVDFSLPKTVIIELFPLLWVPSTNSGSAY